MPDEREQRGRKKIITKTSIGKELLAVFDTKKEDEVKNYLNTYHYSF